MSTDTVLMGAPDPDGYGPWVGVPESRQYVCAFADCTARGRRQVCPYDGRSHHHGCIHYDLSDPRLRTGGWCLLCDEHYAVLLVERERAKRPQS